MLQLTIRWANYARVVSVALFVVAWFVFVFWLEWSEATAAFRWFAALFLLFTVLGSLRALWVYRPHCTDIDPTKIVGEPSWSATVLDCKFNYVDVCDETGGRRRVRYVDDGKDGEGDCPENSA